MKKLLMTVLLLTLTFSLQPLWSATATENAALKTVTDEIAAVTAGKSEYTNNLGRYSDFKKDLLKLLSRYTEIGSPKTMLFNGKPAKILVPLNLDAKTIGGFFQVSADGRKIISYLVWDKTLKPLFTVDRSKWEATADAALLPELAELLPIKEGHSAGVPVEKAELSELFLIDYIDLLPSKTQEEREAYTSTVGLKSQLGRRTGSSKCLSYSASLASDWWNIAQGNKIGNYDSFVNGAREYGSNPRLVESLYFSFPKCPYAFIKETGLDRVTGEKIPYSPKHYAWLMSSVKLPEQINDPLKPRQKYAVPSNGFGMDLPFMNTFDRSKGKIENIRADLQKFGIMYAQHTSRLFKDKVSLTLQGVHSVNIVGTAKLKGEPVVIYYETFGKNNRDYIEDSFYGPALRAFPVKFFYQGIVFPHRINSEISLRNGNAEIAFKTGNGKPIIPEALAIKINGKKLNIKPAANISIPITEAGCTLSVDYSRRYFYTPEEANGYSRNYLINKNRVIELSQYEAILKCLADRSGGVLKKVLGKDDSYTDYLATLADQTAQNLEKQLTSLRSDKELINQVAAEVNKSSFLKRSALGGIIADMVKFNKINN